MAGWRAGANLFVINSLKKSVHSIVHSGIVAADWRAASVRVRESALAALGPIWNANWPLQGRSLIGKHFDVRHVGQPPENSVGSRRFTFSTVHSLH